MKLEGRNILVTGAGGFIGKHLVAELINYGAQVLHLVDNDGSPIDITDWQSIRKFTPRLPGRDIVYHLAAVTSVPYSFENPREIYLVNVLGTLNVLELSRLCHAEKVIFVSAYVYGQPQYLPIDEKHPTLPSNPYARSKLLGEELCQSYHRDHGLKSIIVRPFNVYGEGAHGNFLMCDILRQMANGKVELMDPEPRRDFLYIRDAITALIKAGEYDETGLDIFNIGSGVSYSVAEIVDKIISAWGSADIAVSYKYQRRKNEIMDTEANIKKAKEKLGWQPKIYLEEGIRRYVDWFKRTQT